MQLTFKRLTTSSLVQLFFAPVSIIATLWMHANKANLHPKVIICSEIMFQHFWTVGTNVPTGVLGATLFQSAPNSIVGVVVLFVFFHHCGLRFEFLFLRVLDVFWPRGATWSGQVISSPPGPSGGPSKTHLLPGGGVPRVHRARSPVLPRLPRFATPRSVHQFAAVATGAYPLRRPPNAWSPGAPAPPGPCYWLVASGTPLGSRGGCLA